MFLSILSPKIPNMTSRGGLTARCRLKLEIDADY